MFIKLTNASEGRKGDPILINVNHILSVYENPTDGGSLQTVIYGFNNLSWTVEEGFSVVAQKIQEAKTEK
jgi:hypothetical protein